MTTHYEPQQYWSSRLTRDFNLRGVGHLEYNESYNFWLYCQKRSGLDRALAGRSAGTSALDIGSGVGWVVQYLLGRGFRVTGCDIADVAVARLRDEYPAAAFFPLTVGTDPIPRPDATFDVITMMDVAYHIVDDELWRRAIGEFSRVLKPNGQIVVTDALGSQSIQEAEHVRKRSLAEWEDAAEAAGLRIAQVGSLFRWLSRSSSVPGWRHVPDGPRGAAEFLLERMAPVTPHLRWAVLVQAGPSPR
ncbi:MAG TPA: class I SAM-dependent methyltransferase [Solirubrobacteraceae bacterium]|nr:class I SAM-dependent methyltransferase [Solirubrobacteraceae bacterium]